jgi:hypothetical protein
MSWREERDALIAQSLAFVESVTGKPTDFAESAPEAAIAEAPAAPVVPPTPDPRLDAAGPPPSLPEQSPLIVAPGDDARSEGSLTDAAEPPAPVSTTSAQSEPDAVVIASITGRPFTSITSQLGLQRDMQAEIRARVASFRANQERFNRERQEYFSSTLARLRASMNDMRRPNK